MEKREDSKEKGKKKRKVGKNKMFGSTMCFKKNETHGHGIGP